MPLISIMQLKIIIIFICIFIINSTLWAIVKLDSRLDNNIFILRSIIQGPDYSFCLINSFDNKNLKSETLFSFENIFLRAGRVKRAGFWRELYRPLTASANSDLFNEAVGLVNNYSLSKGGITGLSLELSEGSGINFLFTDNLWLGAYYTITSDFLFLTGFLSSISHSNKPSDNWTHLYALVPDSRPIHTGIHTTFYFHKFTIDYLGALSGSNVFKTGSYHRLFIDFQSKLLHIKSFAGITSPYFLSTDVKIPVSRYLLSLWAELNLIKNFQTIFKTDYQKDHHPVLPVPFIPSSGNSFCQLKYENSRLIISSAFGQKFSYNSEGLESVENYLDEQLGIYGKFSVFIDYGLSFDFDLLTERRIELKVKTSILNTDLELVYKNKEEIYVPVDENTLRLRVDQDFGTGEVYFKIELGNEFELEELSIGFSIVVE
jgi:hypothetical protein